MNMHLIDWAIVFGFMGFLTIVAFRTKKYTRGVADFLVAGRGAGRYLTGIARDAVSMGAITMIAYFQVYYLAGLPPLWWALMGLPINILISFTGWVIYRFRQTRAMTISQFFEVRYSRNLRVGAGMLAFLAGIINFGIFPSVGSRAIMYFMGLPETYTVLGLGISTYATIMLILIGTAVMFCFLGGQVTVLLTDFSQSIFLNVMFIVIVFFLYRMFTWDQITDILTRAPDAKSMIHPFQTGKVKYFDFWFFAIAIFMNLYAKYSWQGSANYMSSTKSAHEAKMGQIFGEFRFFGRTLFYLMLPLCALVFLYHSDFASQSGPVHAILDAIKNPEVRLQMTIPVVLSHILPIGLVGAFATVVLAAFISTHDTYLLNWSSVFVQDVILPLRKKPFTPKNHIRAIRLSVFGVAVFIFFFSLLFRHTQRIVMFFRITGAIYTSGAGIVLIGGLYWKRGTTLGAWFSMIIGAILGVGGVVIKQINPDFPLTGAVMLFFACLIATVVYVVVSLLDKNPRFNMNRMLHRGKYARAEDVALAKAVPAKGWRVLGMGKEFSVGDRVMYIAALAKILIFFGVFLFFTLYNISHKVSVDTWVKLWRYYLHFLFGLAIATTIWFLFGGLHDLKFLLNKLRTSKRDIRDDGRVIGHHLADEEEETEEDEDKR